MTVRKTLVVTTCVAMLATAGACGSSSQGATDSTSSVVASTTSVDAPDFAVVLKACREAVTSLGFKAVDASEPFSADFDGILIFPGFFVSEGIGEVFVKGDVSVLSEPHYRCELGAASPGDCLDVPYVVVNAGGKWAVIDQQIPSLPPIGVVTVPAPVDHQPCTPGSD